MDPDAYAGVLLSSARELHAVLHGWAGLPPDPELSPGHGEWSNDAFLSEGKAISPLSAGRCIVEHQRTAVFLRGIREAIADSLKRFSERPLRILYAGTGPFAPLLLCQTPYFAPSEVRFALLDCHEISLNSLGNVINYLELDDYVDAIVRTDATSYNPRAADSSSSRFHLVVSEVMQRALEKEPQVAVTENLRAHLVEGGAFIPEQVDVSLCLLDPDHEHRSVHETEREPEASLYRKRYWTTPLLSLRSDNMPAFDAEGESRLCHFELPDFFSRRLLLYYLTDITVYENHTLGEYDCSLTLPTPAETEIPPTPGMRLEAFYKKGEIPGIRLRVRKAAPTPEER